MNGTETLEEMNKHDESYYGRPDRAAMVMRIANFPDEMLSFLQMEALVAYNAVQVYGCDGIVELGCYDGRSMELSRSLRLSYLGLDLDAQSIETLRSRIAAEAIEDRAAAFVANALDVDRWASKIRAERPLIHLPFNFLGGFRSPTTLLHRLRDVPGALLLVSMFSTSDYSTQVRRRYYSACGVEALAVSGCSEDTVTFTGERNFYSRAFTPDTLRALFEQCEIDMLLQMTNRLGICAVVKHRAPMTISNQLKTANDEV
jgi:hypothetical protein